MFAWGANSHGQLGIGTFEDKHAPTKVALDAKPQLISGGGAHSLLVCESNTVYIAGRLTETNCKASSTFRPQLFSPEKLDGRVKQVASGWDFSLLLTAAGYVFCCGRNAPGFQCDASPDSEAPPKWFNSWTKLPLKSVKAVSTGLRDAVTVLDSGVVQHWTRRPDAHRFNGTDHIVNLSSVGEDAGLVLGCSTGAYHSVVWTDSGHVAVWGNLRFGLGGPLSAPKTDAQTAPAVHWLPSRLFNNERVISVTSGWSHILALTESGSLYTWGRSDFGQLGRALKYADTPPAPSASGDKPTVWPIKGKTFDPTPGRVVFRSTPESQSSADEEVRITRVVAGSEHCLALDQKQRLWSWGWNEHGMCGLGQTSEADKQTPDLPVRTLDPSDSGWCVKRPSLVRFPGSTPFSRICSIGSGYGHSFAVVET